MRFSQDFCRSRVVPKMAASLLAHGPPTILNLLNLKGSMANLGPKSDHGKNVPLLKLQVLLLMFFSEIWPTCTFCNWMYAMLAGRQVSLEFRGHDRKPSVLCFHEIFPRLLQEPRGPENGCKSLGPWPPNYFKPSQFERFHGEFGTQIRSWEKRSIAEVASTSVDVFFRNLTDLHFL